MAILDDVKLAIRVTSNDFNAELTTLIEAAQTDLGIAGVEVPDELDAIVTRAICTYCKANFGAPEPADYDKFKESYDEQKAQLATATGYTEWSDS